MKVTQVVLAAVAGLHVLVSFFETFQAITAMLTSDSERETRWRLRALDSVTWATLLIVIVLALR